MLNHQNFVKNTFHFENKVAMGPFPYTQNRNHNSNLELRAQGSQNNAQRGQSPSVRQFSPGGIRITFNYNLPQGQQRIPQGQQFTQAPRPMSQPPAQRPLSQPKGVHLGRPGSVMSWRVEGPRGGSFPLVNEDYYQVKPTSEIIRSTGIKTTGEIMKSHRSHPTLHRSPVQKPLSSPIM